MFKENHKEKILIADDDPYIVKILRDRLNLKGFPIITASDGEECLKNIVSESPSILILDLQMPKMDGLEVLENALQHGTNAQFIMISAHGNIETAVDAVKKGAYDFIQKPPDLNRLLITLRMPWINQASSRKRRRLRKKSPKTMISSVNRRPLSK